MSGEPVVVAIEGSDSEGENTASFEAGVAAATSAQAKQEAQGAGWTAEAAAETASQASQTAEAAVDAAYDAKADIGSLRTEFADFMSEMRGALVPAVAPPAQDEVPAPEPAAEVPAAEETPKKKRRRYGSGMVFGPGAYEDDE